MEETRTSWRFSDAGKGLIYQFYNLIPVLNVW